MWGQIKGTKGNWKCLYSSMQPFWKEKNKREFLFKKINVKAKFIGALMSGFSIHYFNHHLWICKTLGPRLYVRFFSFYRKTWVRYKFIGALMSGFSFHYFNHHLWICLCAIVFTDYLFNSKWKYKIFST